MRSSWIKVHLYLAAFFLPMLLAMAVSGGFYLLGIKGSVTSTPVSLNADQTLSLDSTTLESDVRKLLDSHGIDHDFEYLKVSGNTLMTRPTSSDYYKITVLDDGLEATLNDPDWLASLVELHKGHGPVMYKNLQKLMALGLVIILMSGFWLGASSPRLRLPTLLTAAGGLLALLILGYIA